MESITVGSFRISEVEDGVGHLPPMFYPGADFESQPDLLHEDGTYHIRGGGYVIQGQGAVVLIDAGTGPDDVPFPSEVANAAGLAAPPKNIMNSGLLPASLAKLGIKPESVTHIVLTHLHLDHIGWVAPKGERLFFPNAEIYYGDADWTPLIANVPSDDPHEWSWSSPASTVSCTRCLNHPSRSFPACVRSTLQGIRRVPTSLPSAATPTTCF